MKKEISQEFITKQLYRIYHLGGFPQTNEGMQDLCRTLQSNCQSEAHVERLITAWLESPRVDGNGRPQAPGVSEIIKLAGESGEREREAACQYCAGDGFLPQRPIIREGIVYPHVQRCVCNGGKPVMADLPVPEDGARSNSGYFKNPMDFFIKDLANRPDMIEKWKRMSAASHNSVGYPLSDAQRKFAAKVIRDVEDFTGTAIA